MAKKKYQEKIYMPMKKDVEDEYSRKKESMMTEEQISRCSTYLDWYRASWQAKDNEDLFNLWSDLDDAWEGNLNEALYVDDPASNTNIIHPTIEGQVALMVGQEVGIQVYPATPSEIPYLRSITTMLEFVKDNNDYLLKKDIFIRRFKKFGTGIYRVLFDKDWENGFGLPKISSLNPFYVFPDPNVTDVQKIQDGRFIIETSTKPIVWAERNFGKEKAACIIPNFEPMVQAQYFGEGKSSSSELGNQYYLHLFIWEKIMNDKGKLELRLTQMSADGTLLWDSIEEKHKFPNSDFPHFFAPCYYREGTIWGKADAELLLDAQMQLNDYDDQIRSNARLCGNPQKWANISMVPDLDKWTGESGLIIPTQGTGSESAGYFVPPSIPPYIINRRDRIMDQDRFQVTRFYEQMVGGRIKGVDTATEALQLQNSGMAGLDYQKNLIAKVESNMFEYIFRLCLFEYNSLKMFKIKGKDMNENKFDSFNPSELNKIPEMMPATEGYINDFKYRNKGKKTPQFMAKTDKNGKTITKDACIKIDIKITPGTEKNKATTYNVMKESFAMGAITLEEYRKYIADNMALPIEPALPQELKPQMPEQQNAAMGGMGTTNPTGVQKPMPQQITEGNSNKKGMNEKDAMMAGGL